MNGAAGGAELPWVAAWRDWVAQLGKGFTAPAAGAARDGAASGFATAYIEFARAVQRLLGDAPSGEFAAKLAAALRGEAGGRTLNDFLRAAPAALLKNMPGAQAEQIAGQWSATLRRWGEELLALPLIGPQREWQSLAQGVERAALAEEAARERIARHYDAALRAGLEGLAASLEQDDGPPITSLRALYDLWVDQAETAYAARVMTPAFAVDFAAWVDAGSDLRLAWKSLLARVAGAMDAPQREEIDALLARQRALEREIAELRRARAEVVRPAPVPETPPVKAPVATATPAPKPAPKPARAAKPARASRRTAPPATARPPAPRKPAQPRGEFDIAGILGGK